MDYKVLPAVFGEEFQHYFYVKQHKSKDPTAPSDRTLFIANIPINANEHSLKDIFSVCGEVKEIRLGNFANYPLPATESIFELDQKKPVHTAHIIFENPEGLQNALQVDEIQVDQAELKKKQDLFGVEKWLDLYHKSRPEPRVLQKDVASFMQKWDAEKRAHSTEIQAKWNVPDADGFVTVQRVGKFKQGDTVVHGVKAADAQKWNEEKKRKKKQQIKPEEFYNFLNREKKREHLADLRRQFEADKKRVAEMKKNRKFKPY